MTTTLPSHAQPPQRKIFATLTGIHQTGTKREWDGTTTYSFLAQVINDGPPVLITLTITPALVLQVQASFDDTMKARGRQGEVSV